MFPKSFVDNDPLYATMFLTDLGSLGLDPVFHHLYEYGNVGTFGVLGRPRAEQIADPDTGRLERKRIAMIRWSFDERIEDGLYAGYGIKQVKKLLEDPVKGGIAAGDDAVLAALGRDGGGRRRAGVTPGVAARFPQAGLATPHYLASGAGAAELARGGNAIDAIVAANLALGVVAPYLCGYGGDLFAIVWDGELHGYLGSGRSPGRARASTTVSELLGDEPLLVGPHSVTVPGAIAGWFDLLERWGTRPFADLARDAIRYARDGFELTPMGAFSCIAFRGLYRGLDDWQAVYGQLEAGDVLRQPALARLIELLAEEGPKAYYRGRRRRRDRHRAPAAAAG